MKKAEKCRNRKKENVKKYVEKQFLNQISIYRFLKEQQL